MHDGQQLAAQPIDWVAVNVLDSGAALLLVDADQLQQVDLGNCKALLAASDDQRRHDGQGQRDADLESRPVAKLCLLYTSPFRWRRYAHRWHCRACFASLGRRW